MSSSLEIKYEMQAYDRKDRAYYDNFTDDDRKKFSTYLMLKYGANVGGGKDMQAYYLMATNERVNKNFFDIGRHPKLQWLLCTTVSPGMGAKRHYWIKASKGNGNQKAFKFIESQYPHLSREEIDIMVKLNTTEQLKELARNLGWDDKRIKTDL